LGVLVKGGAVVSGSVSEADGKGGFEVRFVLRNPSKRVVEAGLSVAGVVEVEWAGETEKGLQLWLAPEVGVNLEVLDRGETSASGWSVAPADELESVVWAVPGEVRGIRGEAAVAISWQNLVMGSNASVEVRFHVSFDRTRVTGSTNVSRGRRRGEGAKGEGNWPCLQAGWVNASAVNWQWSSNVNSNASVYFRIDLYVNSSRTRTTYKDEGWRWVVGRNQGSWRFLPTIGTSECVEELEVSFMVQNRRTQNSQSITIGLFADLQLGTGQDASIEVSWDADGGLTIPGLNNLRVSPGVPATWPNKYSGAVCST
jgi:hypothetical protein